MEGGGSKVSCSIVYLKGSKPNKRTEIEDSAPPGFRRKSLNFFSPKFGGRETGIQGNFGATVEG